MDFKKALRVCVVSPLYHTSLGGVGRQGVALTEKLASLGVKVLVIKRRMKGMPVCSLSENIPVHTAWAFRAHVHILEKISVMNLLISLSFSLSTVVILFIKRKEYDIVHFHGASLPLIINILPIRVCRKKVIAKVAAANLKTEAGSLSGNYFLLSRMLIWVLNKVDCFIATSEEIREGLLNDGCASSKIVKIPNFIDQEVFYPSDQKFKRKLKKQLNLTNRKIVTFSGRLVERKGIDVLLNAWARIADENENTLLVILGGGPLQETLKNQCRLLGIEKRVRLCGVVDNVRDYLAATDIFVFPSFQEGFPNAVLEAMACSLPVISSRIGGVVDAITNGENGVLVEPGNANELLDALQGLIRDGEYASTLGKCALKTIGEFYSINMISKKYVTLYEKLMTL